MSRLISTLEGSLTFRQEFLPSSAKRSRHVQGRSQKKLMTEAMSMEDLWLRQSVHGRVLFLGIKSAYTTKVKEITEASASVGLLLATTVTCRVRSSRCCGLASSHMLVLYIWITSLRLPPCKELSKKNYYNLWFMMFPEISMHACLTAVSHFGH